MSMNDVEICEGMSALTVAEILQNAFDEAGNMCDWDRENDEVWEECYDKIFSASVSQKIWKMFPDFEYFDPDASYYEDVEAFVNNFVDWARR